MLAVLLIPVLISRTISFRRAASGARIRDSKSKVTVDIRGLGFLQERADLSLARSSSSSEVGEVRVVPRKWRMEDCVSTA